MSLIHTKTALKVKTSLGMVMLGLTGVATRVYAAAPKPMDALKSTANQAGFNTQGTSTPADIAGNIIGYALGLLGIIFVILVIYAGFLWMTAQGNEEQITKAKKMITNAVIGIIIISMAYIITNFVLTNIQESTTATSAPATP